MNRILIATFVNRSQAEPLKQRLIDHGIPAEVHDELMLEKFWFVSRPKAGVRLEVPAGQFEKAYRMVIDWDAADGALRDAVRCPECNSPRVKFPQFTRKSFLTNLVMGTLATIGRVEKEYYCEDCHFTWPKEAHYSPPRPHMAPNYFIEDVESTANPRAKSESGVPEAKAPGKS